MSGNSERPQLIRYPIGPGDSKNESAGTWARLGLVATLALLLVGGVGGYTWNQPEASLSAHSQCDEVRVLAQHAEQTAVGTLATRNSLLKELDDLPWSLAPALVDRANELRRQIPAQESRVLFGYSEWEDVLNVGRNCFGRADLIFAETRIKMVRVLFE